MNLMLKVSVKIWNSTKSGIHMIFGGQPQNDWGGEERINKSLAEPCCNII